METKQHFIHKIHKKTIGVYAIKNIVNSKIYVGSSANSIKVRWDNHLRDLLRNNHPNAKLQRSFTKYGEINFIIYVKYYL